MYRMNAYAIQLPHSHFQKMEFRSEHNLSINNSRFGKNLENPDQHNIAIPGITSSLCTTNGSPSGIFPSDSTKMRFQPKKVLTAGGPRGIMYLSGREAGQQKSPAPHIKKGS